MRADRLLSLLLLLQTRGRTTAAELAERLEVSERTIYRDLEALSVAGVPVCAERGPGGGCRLLDGYRTNLTGLTAPEVQALFLIGSPGLLADLGLGPALNGVLLKLLAALPAAHRPVAERARARVHLDTIPWYRTPETTPHLGVLQEAVGQDRRLRLVYQRGDGQPSERVVEPYGLVAKADVWYLVAKADGQLRSYRVSRIADASLTEESFARDAAFDLAAFWAASSAAFKANLPRYPVIVRLAPEALAMLTFFLGQSAQTALGQAGPPDENGWRTLSLDFDTVEEARKRILGLGEHAEVLAPPDLRESVAEAAARLAAVYALGGVR